MLTRLKPKFVYYFTAFIIITCSFFGTFSGFADQSSKQLINQLLFEARLHDLLHRKQTDKKPIKLTKDLLDQLTVNGVPMMPHDWSQPFEAILSKQKPKQTSTDACKVDWPHSKKVSVIETFMLARLSGEKRLAELSCLIINSNTARNKDRTLAANVAPVLLRYAALISVICKTVRS